METRKFVSAGGFEDREEFSEIITVTHCLHMVLFEDLNSGAFKVVKFQNRKIGIWKYPLPRVGRGAEEMAHGLKDLLHEHEDMSFDPRPPPGAGHGGMPCKPWTEEEREETGTSQELQVQREANIQKQVEK